MNAITMAAAVLAATLAAGVPAETARSGDVHLGKLVLRISEAQSAQVFHVVDQLSAWSEFCHPQYARWAARAIKLADADRALLAKHAELRKARGWGGGFEQAFYVDSSIDQAADQAARTGALTAEEIKAEKELLLHFAPMLRPLLEAGRGESRGFRARLAQQAEGLAPMMEKLAHFAGVTAPVVVPVFLIPNPEKGSSGGGFNGGRLVLEIQAQPDPMPTLLHESLHAFLESHREDIATAARRGNGLDEQSLNEGLAYALAPGLVGTADEGADELSEVLVLDVLRGTKPTDPYLRFKLVAVVLRPLLRDALERGLTLAEFLPRAVDRWNQVQGRR